MNRNVYTCAWRHMCENAHKFKKANTWTSRLHNFKIHLTLPLLSQVVSCRLWLLRGEISNAMSRTCTTYIWLPATQPLWLGIPLKNSACITWKKRSYTDEIILDQWRTGANGQWTNVSTSVLPGEQFWNALHRVPQKMLTGLSTSRP